MSEVAGFVLGVVVGVVLSLNAVSNTDKRDIDRGWSYLDGEKYFLKLDDDMEKECAE